MKESKIIAVSCKPGAYAQVVCIDNTLEALQEHVGGFIECVGLHGGRVLICNEEGKLQGLQPCRAILDENQKPVDVVCGTFLIVAQDGEEFGSLSSAQIGRSMLEYGKALEVQNA